jgi:hypothetical protein
MMEYWVEEKICSHIGNSEGRYFCGSRHAKVVGEKHSIPSQARNDKLRRLNR